MTKLSKFEEEGNHITVAVVGRVKAGKTTIIKRMVQHSSFNPEYTHTKTATKLFLYYADTKYIIWDKAGKEFSEVDHVVLVFNPNCPLTEVEADLAVVRRHAPNASISLVANARSTLNAGSCHTEVAQGHPELILSLVDAKMMPGSTLRLNVLDGIRICVNQQMEKKYSTNQHIPEEPTMVEKSPETYTL